MILRHSSSDEISTIAISSSLAVLSWLIEVNQSVQVIQRFTVIVETTSAYTPENFMVSNAQKASPESDVVSTSALHCLVLQLNQLRKTSSAFELSRDLPGFLSDNVARHDNGDASIADVLMLPIAQEIASSPQEYLPLVDSTQHHLPGLTGLLDRQFRFQRKDTVEQLQNAVREEVTSLAAEVEAL